MSIPRLAEMLGVDVGEPFKVSDFDGGWDGDVVFYINEYGKFISGIAPGSSIALCCAIQHPESIIRVSRLKEPETANARVMQRVTSAPTRSAEAERNMPIPVEELKSLNGEWVWIGILDPEYYAKKWGEANSAYYKSQYTLNDDSFFLRLPFFPRLL